MNRFEICCLGMLKVATQESEEEVVDECGSDSGKRSHRDNYHHEADAKFSKSQVRSSSHAGRSTMSIARICTAFATSVVR
jgi:hypothetical protein